MTPIPRIPQHTPRITTGDATTGSEVIDVHVTTGAASTQIEITGEQRWALAVSDATTRTIDLIAGPANEDTEWRAAGALLVRRLTTVIAGHPVRAKKHLVQVHLPEGMAPADLRSFCIGLSVGSHSYQVTNEKRRAKVRKIRLVVPSGARSGERLALEKAANLGRILGEATCLARDLANTPSNVKTPAWLARTIGRLLGSIEGVKVRVRDEEWLAERGFGGLMAVGSGSANPPRLLEAVWDPEHVGKKRRRGTALLVGKGVTFDTGGVSVKPANGMDTMITDMTGAASAAAAFRALAEGQVARKVVLLLPMAENMISGTSYRPGDVVEHYGGITSHVTNTDAEGRMVLADALSFGTKRHKPEFVLSIATLTGAAKIALGMRTGAVLTDDWRAAVRLARRGFEVGERWWPLPMPDYLEEKVDARVADVEQCPKGPGTITAAMFLRRFTRNTPHIHLDIAGPGRAEDTYEEVTPLGTGFGARTLVHWLSH